MLVNPCSRARIAAHAEPSEATNWTTKKRTSRRWDYQSTNVLLRTEADARELRAVWRKRGALGVFRHRHVQIQPIQVDRHEIEVRQEVWVILEYKLVIATKLVRRAHNAGSRAVAYRPLLPPSASSAAVRIVLNIIRMLLLAASASCNT